MKTANNGIIHESQMTFFHSHERFLVEVLGCILLRCWTKRYYGDPLTAQADAKAEVHSLKTDSSAL